MAEQKNGSFVEVIDEINGVFWKYAQQTCKEEEKASEKLRKRFPWYAFGAMLPLMLVGSILEYMLLHRANPQLTVSQYIAAEFNVRTMVKSFLFVVFIFIYDWLLKFIPSIINIFKYPSAPEVKPVPQYNFITVGKKYHDALSRDLNPILSRVKDASFPAQDRLTVCAALLNGCALYNVPRTPFNDLWKSLSAADFALVKQFETFFFQQVRTGDAPDVSAILDTFGRYDGEACPHVVSLYLFAAALARYFPEETDQEMRALAQRCYHRVPPLYRDFMVGKIVRQADSTDVPCFLLPQLRQKDFSSMEPDAAQASFFSLRKARLYLPLYVYYSKDPYSHLTTKLMRTVLSKEELDRLGDSSVYSLQSMIRYFAHTYGNLDTKMLEDVTADLLARDDPELRLNAHKLIAETMNKKELLVGIKMLHLRCREDRGELQARLRNSLASADADTAVDMADLFDSGLRVCLFRIMYNINDTKANIGRQRLPVRLPDGTYRRVDFENKVIVGKQRCIDWLRATSPFIQFELDITGAWQDVHLYNESFAAVLWEYLLGELAFNALKYGDIEKPIRFVFRTEGRWMSVIAENALPAQEEDHIRGEGLALQKEMLAFLTGQDDCLTQEDTGSVFRVQAKVPRSLFLP